MKRILPLLITALLIGSSAVKAQISLNEIYAEPGAGNQEFVELYNLNTGNTPISVDGYTVISYFEEGNKKGFYVLDLPNVFIPSKGYFVASSAIPFSYQGHANSTASNISWNDPALSTQHGYLRKWIDNGNNASDGNRNYDIETLPVNFNDFFSKRNGGGASYNALVFQNGKFINSFFGGTGGSTNMPSFITSMPVFRLLTVTAGSTTTSTINWNTLRNKQIEFVTQDIGNDNGFIKSRDGFCGAWTKSSATAFHTPGVTNSASSSGATGSLTINARLYTGTTSGDPAFVVYNITAGPTETFPVELQVYMDNGSIPGNLDMNDEFVETRIENAVSDGPSTTYLPRNRNVLIVARADAGCIDQIIYVRNSLIDAIVLPVKLVRFEANSTGNQNWISWNVDENEEGDLFEVQVSTDGKYFSTAATIASSGRPGLEIYNYKEMQNDIATYYRLKIINKNKTVTYSKTIYLRHSTNQGINKLSLLQNPVREAINLEYNSFTEGSVSINVYDMTGTLISTSHMAVQKGLNRITLDSYKIRGGTYIVKIMLGKISSTVKFVKHQ